MVVHTIILLMDNGLPQKKQVHVKQEERQMFSYKYFVKIVFNILFLLFKKCSPINLVQRDPDGFQYSNTNTLLCVRKLCLKIFYMKMFTPAAQHFRFIFKSELLRTINISQLYYFKIPIIKISAGFSQELNILGYGYSRIQV